MDKEKLKSLPERDYDIEKTNFLNTSQQRQSYLEHKYENEYRRDALISIISTGAIGYLISFIQKYQELHLHYCKILILWSIVFFWVTLVLSLINFHISSKAFSVEIEKIDNKDKNTQNFYNFISESVTVISLFSITIGVLLAFIFLFTNF